ncbi:MAG: DUF2341 domain-containing protein, partial [Methanobacteriota archaeon]
MRQRAKESHRVRATTLVAALLMLLLVVPSWPTGKGTANFGTGPYTLNMYFEELPKPWLGGDWWNSSWTIRQKLSFDTQSINEDLPDFPVLIKLNDSRIDYTNTQNAGEDIRFVDADGTTVLDHEIERWNESGTSLVWVRVPLIDRLSTTDHIWMYYGNQTVLDGQNPSNVWDSNYLMVQHMNEANRTTGSNNDHLDSTSNGNHLEAVMNEINMSVPGFIGGADNFDGNNDYLDSNGDEMDASEFQGTIELWVKLDNTASTRSIFSTEENRDRAIWTEGGQFRAGMNTGAFTSRVIGGGVLDNDWHHLVFSWDILNGNLFLYLDGTLVDSDLGSAWSTSGRFIPTRYGHFEILSLSFPVRDYLDGMMDEIRVSSAVHSPDWNAAQYSSMTDTFVSFGKAQLQFQYIRGITITAGSSSLPPGYTVSIDLDHASLVAAGKSQADGDDVRMFYWNTTEWVEIDRILDPASSWNSNSTRVWFALYRGIESSTTERGYYVHYGNTVISNPPTNVNIGTRIESVQSGTAVSMASGTITVNITQVDMSKAFLIFNTRHNGNRPVSSELSGRIATPTSLEFARSTDEGIPSPISVHWYVVEYYSGVRVQRGEIPSMNSTMFNLPISQITAVQQAFVTWSKTPTSTDVNWSSDDPVVGELTNTSNLQFRVQGANSGHAIWWQVVEFTDPALINVQKGSIFTMTGPTTSVNATLSVPVDVNKSFVLVGFRMSGGGPIVGANMLRAQLVDSTTVMIDRCLSGSPNNITEINWQVVELKDGSSVLAGSQNIRSGMNQETVRLPVSVDVDRSVAFASVQPASGQNMGRSPYAGDDITGVGSVTMALSDTEITMDRDNTAD